MNSRANLRSPLARVLNHGAAHDGVHHWWVMRLTAVALAPLCVWLTVSLLTLPGTGYAAVSAWVAAGLNPVLLALTTLLAAWHSGLGLQAVIEDYVAQPLWKTSLLVLSGFLNALLAASGVYAVLRIALRSVA
jgi:succinate dehydrogenase / fumarate reductase membrane anchor subunit